MTSYGGDWQPVDGLVTAWFEATSLAQGVALAARVLEADSEALVDVRAAGVRVRLTTQEHAATVSAAATELGLRADPGALQVLGVIFETSDASAVGTFWRDVLAYEPAGESALADPLRRDPAVRFAPSTETRVLRNRIHLDVVRPDEVVERVSAGEASGPYGVRHADADGNEVDLVPGGQLGETDDTADWQAVFGAVAVYRVGSAGRQADVAAAAATLADEAGFPLLIDLRPGLVVLDSGKDQWEPEAHGLDVDFAALARRIQDASRRFGAVPEPEAARFVQLFLDAADVEVLRAFWESALGYVRDRRAGTTDLYDPRRLNPELVFQERDASDTARRAQRNRVLVELHVPGAAVQDRAAAIIAAGGRLIEETTTQSRFADPEGNELVLIGG